jgi:hypothetical protein
MLRRLSAEPKSENESTLTVSPPLHRPNRLMLDPSVAKQRVDKDDPKCRKSINEMFEPILTHP